MLLISGRLRIESLGANNKSASRGKIFDSVDTLAGTKISAVSSIIIIVDPARGYTAKH
jgi:hypothetical protein